METEIIEIPIHFSYINSQKKRNPLSFTFIVIPENGKIKSAKNYDFYLTKFLHLGKENTEVSLLDSKKFSGILKVFNIDGKTLLSQMFSNGTSIGDTKLISNLNKQNAEMQGCILITFEYITDWYKVYPDRHREKTSETTRYIQETVNSGSGGSQPDSGDPLTDEPQGRRIYSERIERYLDEDIPPPQIINNLEGKANCTYLKLKNNNLLVRTIEKFKGKTPVNLIINQELNLSIKDENGNNVLVNGITNYSSSYNIKITLNTEQSNNRPSLAVARTILHEAIHAEIYRKIKTTSGLSYSNGVWRLPDGSRVNFPSLFDAYNENPSNPDHNYMAKYYREALESGMREYANSIGETHSDQFYKDMAWNGLLDTKAWEINMQTKNMQRMRKKESNE